MRPVVFSEDARADALETFAFYEGRRRGLGARFRDHLDLAVRRVSEDPERYPLVYRELRRRLVERFPYAVYFRVYPELVFVVAVMHGSRDPQRWRARGDTDP